MYIQKAEIKNIRSIINFEIEFKNPAGWHVLIGDNGAGKSTIVRSMALALVEKAASGLRANWEDWIRKNNQVGTIKLNVQRDLDLDKCRHYAIAPGDLGHLPNAETLKDLVYEIYLRKNSTEVNEILGDKKDYLSGITTRKLFDFPDVYYSWSVNSGFFSVAFGPYRRFEGGNEEWEKIFKNPSYANLAAHLSVFDESVALTEPISWLKELNYKWLEKNKESQHTLENLKRLINSEDFLPHNTQLESVSSDGVFFKDGNNTIILVNQMSDGYRSILSMTFELIRQLVRVYGSELVFKNIKKGEMFIDLPGVVLVDEIDAHLHPTWQTRIGQWFLKCFPKLQFIVTTHSPLVCRAAENGSIWRLAAPGSDEKSGEITGLDRERLIYGNVLDAYGTEVFGENVSISEEANEMLNRLSELNVKSMMGLIEDKETEELQKLRAILPTENKVNL
ncbi:MAG: AAA family ATPase [Pyrinomonadaceae bacterium]